MFVGNSPVISLWMHGGCTVNDRPNGTGTDRGFAGWSKRSNEPKWLLGLLQDQQQIRNQITNVVALRESLSQSEAAYESKVDRLKVGLRLKNHLDVTIDGQLGNPPCRSQRCD